MTRGSVRTLRLRDRLRALFARSRSTPGNTPGKFQESRWEAEDYFESFAINPLVKDPWETGPEHWDPAWPGELIGKAARSCSSQSPDGQRCSSSGAGTAVSLPAVPEEPPLIEAPTEGESQPLTVCNLLSLPPEQGQSSPNTIVAPNEHFQPDLSFDPDPASEDVQLELAHPEASDLQIRIYGGDAAADEADGLREHLAPDGAIEHQTEALGGENPQDNLEQQTFAGVVEHLDFELGDEQVLLDTGPTDDYFDYDPNAHQGPWVDSGDPGDEDGIRRAREKAAAIGSVIEVTSRRDQEAMLDWLTEFFSEFRHSATFRAIKRVAAQDVTPDLLRAVIALRRHWMERSEWWVGRYKPEWWDSRYNKRREVRPTRNGSGGLEWAVALRICRYRVDYPAEDMIDESWFSEWLALSPGAPGYFLFAAYVDAKVADPDSWLLHDGLVREEQSESVPDMGDDRGWWRRLPRYDESTRFGFSVLTPFRDGFGPLGYPETQDRPKRGIESDS